MIKEIALVGYFIAERYVCEWLCYYAIEDSADSHNVDTSHGVTIHLNHATLRDSSLTITSYFEDNDIATSSTSYWTSYGPCGNQ